MAHGTGRNPTDCAFWNARSGVFDGGMLREAIVLRGWTVAELAQTSTISVTCLYNALAGKGVSDPAAIRVFRQVSRSAADGRSPRQQGWIA